MARKPGPAKVRVSGSVTLHAFEELKRIEMVTGITPARALENFAERHGTAIRKSLNPEEQAAFDDGKLDRGAYLRAKLRADGRRFSDLAAA